jgi:hypothetical protein
MHYALLHMIKGLGHIRGIGQKSDPSFFTPKRDRRRATLKRERSAAPVRAPAKAPQASLVSALKYAINRPGFAKRFKKLLVPMHTAASVDEMKRFFTTLPKVVPLARACPGKARAILRKSLSTPKGLYAAYVALACGDDSAHGPALVAMHNLKGNHQLHLSCMERVVRFNTRGSRRLIEALFDHSKKLTPAIRVKLFQQLAMSKGLAYKATLVECFGKIMENSNARDRNRMYASLLAWTDKWNPIDRTLLANRAIVQECMRGQISSCPIVTKGIHLKAQSVLGLSRSARG